MPGVDRLMQPPRPGFAALALALAGLVALGACSPTAAPPTEAPAGATTTPASIAPESMAPASEAPASAVPPASPAPSGAPAFAAPSEAPTSNPAAEALAGRAWATAELTDVSTGEPFRIADYAGRTIFVESMAIWCTNCRQQQGRFREALDRLDPDEVAYVVLTVDPGESAPDLARYKDSQGFTGTYAVAGADVSRALVDEFGSNAINPPRVPLVVVTPDGEISFRTGGESADDIVELAGG
jgi:hypothetical protein